MTQASKPKPLRAPLRLSPRARFSVGSTAALLLLILALVLWQAAERAGVYRDTLDGLTPRYARLLGIQAAGDGLHAALQASRSQLATLAYGASTAPDRVGAEMQQKVRALAESAGLNVATSQLGAVESEELFDAISLNIRVEGSLHDLEALLRGVQSLEPVVQLRSLTITAIPRRVPGARDLRIDLVFVSLRLNA